MSSAQKYDCVVIGAGHNGLIAAAYLARAGRRVCVLERRNIIGGCCASESIWPGYTVSTASYVVSLLAPEIIEELKLKQNGLKILPRNPSSFTPCQDGRYLMLGPDHSANQQEISKFSAADAEVFPEYEQLLTNVAEVLEPTLAATAPDILPLPKSWRNIPWTKRLRDARTAWNMHRAVSRMGKQLPEAIEMLTGAARPILERWFESETLRATLATDAIIGAFAPISAPGTAYVLLHHVMGTAGGARGVWGYVQGGMGALASSIEQVCRELGVDVFTESPVDSIIVDDGRVQGVKTTDGRQFDAPVVASSVDANLTYLKFIDRDLLPPSFHTAIERIDYSSASLKINIALSEPPRFDCLPDNGVGPQHHGTMHICETMDWIERAYDDAKYGRPSERPVLEITMPTSVDTTIAPPGKHIISMFVQYAPYELENGRSWADEKEKFADRCVALLGEYASNIPDAIEHRQVLTPVDLEEVFGLTGGNIFQGAMNFNQLFMMRPVPGWSDHRSPIRGLYLCGAASHPGGGVMGTCGKNAATEILRDRN